MRGPESADSLLLQELIGQVVVVDLGPPFVCLGRLSGWDDAFLQLTDADFHDFRDSSATREIYLHDSVRFGIRRNRSRALEKVRGRRALAIRRNLGKLNRKRSRKARRGKDFA